MYSFVVTTGLNIDLHTLPMYCLCMYVLPMYAYTHCYSCFQCFGAPSIVVHIDSRKELFFGSDRFPVLAMTLGTLYIGSVLNLRRPTVLSWQFHDRRAVCRCAAYR